MLNELRYFWHRRSRTLQGLYIKIICIPSERRSIEVIQNKEFPAVQRILLLIIAPSAGAVEYTDWILTEE